MRKELRRFTELQEAILKQNDHKTPWVFYSNIYLFDKLEKEVAELKIALINGSPSDIQKECADVANFAMMVADNASKQPHKMPS